MIYHEAPFDGEKDRGDRTGMAHVVTVVQKF
jgi:hypothetical protein